MLSVWRAVRFGTAVLLLGGRYFGAGLEGINEVLRKPDGGFAAWLLVGEGELTLG